MPKDSYGLLQPRDMLRRRPRGKPAKRAGDVWPGGTAGFVGRLTAPSGTASPLPAGLATAAPCGRDVGLRSLARHVADCDVDQGHDAGAIDHAPKPADHARKPHLKQQYRAFVLQHARFALCARAAQSLQHEGEGSREIGERRLRRGDRAGHQRLYDLSANDAMWELAGAGSLIGATNALSDVAARTVMWMSRPNDDRLRPC